MAVDSAGVVAAAIASDELSRGAAPRAAATELVQPKNLRRDMKLVSDEFDSDTMVSLRLIFQACCQHSNVGNVLWCIL